jgi:hypothetical protein
MKSIKTQYIDLIEGRMSQHNFMRSVRMSLPQYITNVTSFNFKHTANKEALITELAPKFYWILRDFMLEFVHPESGQPISGKDYFDLCLRKKVYLILFRVVERKTH